MKTKKRLSALIAVLVVVTFVVSGTFIANIQVSAYDISDILQNEEYMAALREEFIVQYGEEFLDNLEQARANDEQLVSLFEQDRLGETIYPNFVGGIFYNEYGNMVLQIVANSSMSRNARNFDVRSYNLVSEFIATTDDIIVEHVNFSQNEINAVMAILDAYWQAEERPEVFDNIDSYHMDTINNRVEVWLRVYNEAEINRFRDTVLDSPIIYLTESIGMIAVTRTINPGMSISEFEGSAGYRVETGGCNNRQGFLTSAHLVRANQVFPNLGSVHWRQWSGTVDAAFIHTNSNITLTNNRPRQSGVISTNVRDDLRVGDSVGMHGGVRGWQTGTIQSVHAAGAGGITRQVATSVDNYGGDSGGPVLFLGRSGLVGPFICTAGIVHGALENQNGIIPRTMRFTRADEIERASGLRRF